MFVNINDSTLLFAPENKVSMRECYIYAYPTNNVNDLKITFSGNNFVQLLEKSGVDNQLIFKLQERKSMNEIESAIRTMVSAEFFLPMYDDDEYLSDEWSTIRDIAELRFETIEDDEIEDHIFFSMLTHEHNSRDFDAVIKFLDFFPKHYWEKEAEFFQKLKEKSEKLEKSIFANSNQYVFEDDGIIISKELGFKIQGEPYQTLLKNTKEYVELHGTYTVNDSLKEYKENAKKRKQIFEQLENGYHHKVDRSNKEDVIEFFKWLVTFSSVFPIYYD